MSQETITTPQKPPTPTPAPSRSLQRKPQPGPLPEGMQYMGPGARFMASVIDNVLILLVIIPLVMLVKQSSFWDSFITPVIEQFQYIGEVQTILNNQLELDLSEIPPMPHQSGPLDILIKVVLPAIAFIVFWRYRSATPGKMVYRAQIVDATSYGPPKTGQLIMRYVGYAAGVLTLFLGFAVILFNKRRMGVHDLLANTVVIMPAPKKGAKAG